MIGVAVEVPFIATELFTGPIGKSLHDTDISWLVGLAVVCPLYYWAGKHYLSRQQLRGEAQYREVPVVDIGV